MRIMLGSVSELFFVTETSLVLHWLQMTKESEMNVRVCRCVAYPKNQIAKEIILNYWPNKAKKN